MARINKCIELLERGEAVYLCHESVPPELSYESGRELAHIWADMIVVEFEHFAFDAGGLARFMRGLKDGGPTASGHATPTVLATLPCTGSNAEEVRSNAWQVRHALAAGVHGLVLAHTREAEAVRWLVAAARYPVASLGRDRLPEGLRGGGGEEVAAAIWGVSPPRYLEMADPWPLNPRGELLLGLKIEDRQGLANADAIAAVPGIAFAEWGPLDMGLSFGYSPPVAPPYPAEVDAARRAVKAALDRAGVALYCGWPDPGMSLEQSVDYALDVAGARLVHAPSAAFAEYGRERSARNAGRRPDAAL